MPTGDAFIDAFSTQALVSPVTKSGERPAETAAVNPAGTERRG
jgi:hypothetical protein